MKSNLLYGDVDRRVIWVVGRGNEGKNFFQDKIREQYGKHRVCKLTLEEKFSDLLHYMHNSVDLYATDIFLFNIPIDVDKRNISYTLLENIKNGNGLSRNFNTMIMRYRTPNVIIVFANGYPDGGKLTRERWLILRINNMMQLVEVKGNLPGSYRS